MGKTKKVFECNNCGNQSSKWTGKCTECESWNTLTEQILSTKKSTLLNTIKKPQLIDNIVGNEADRISINDL